MHRAFSQAVDGFRLAYDRGGQGRTVLLLHGWPGDRSDFAEVARRLDAAVLLPDLRGFGESDKLAGGDYSAAGQARSVLGLLDELGVSAAVLVGCDIGSRIAQAVARSRPDRVRALVVAPPLPGAGDRVLHPAAQAEFWYQSFHQLSLAEELVDGRAEAVRTYLRHFWTHWSGPGFQLTDARLDRLTRHYSQPGAFTASIGWYRAGSGTVRQALAETSPRRRLTMPATALWPEHDPLFPPAWSDRLGEWFADLRLEHLAGVGHFSPVEAPDRFAEAISRALADS